MNQLKNINDLNGKPINGLSFASRYQFNKWMEAEMERLSVQNKKVWRTVDNYAQKNISDKKWWGNPPPSSMRDLQEIKEFPAMGFYKQMRPKFKKQLKDFLKVRSSGGVASKKIAYNDRELGIFSFDRAAIGLHRVKDSQGKERVVTSNKKVYAFHDPKEQQRQAVEIYVKINASANITGDQILNIGIGAAILFEMLEKKGYFVRVFIVDHFSNGPQEYVNIVRVKDFESRLRLQDFLIMSSSARFFRYQAFKGSICLYNHFGHFAPSGLGVPASNFKFNHFVYELPKKNKELKRFIFGNSHSEIEVMKEIETILKSL